MKGQKRETIKERLQHGPNPLAKRSVFTVRKNILEEIILKGGLRKRRHLRRHLRGKVMMQWFQMAMTLQNIWQFPLKTLRRNGFWIRGSHCMCPTRTYFYDYQKLNAGSVYLENNQAYKVIGIGIVKTRSTNGTVRFLRNV